jgi:hypothetical protein
MNHLLEFEALRFRDDIHMKLALLEDRLRQRRDLALAAACPESNFSA